MWETAGQSGWAKWKEDEEGKGMSENVSENRETLCEKMAGHVERGQEVNLFDASRREINYFCLLRVFLRSNDFQISVTDVISFLFYN